MKDRDKLETFTHLFGQTFEWGCNDRAKCLYAKNGKMKLVNKIGCSLR